MANTEDPRISEPRETIIILRLSEGSELLEVKCHTCTDSAAPATSADNSTQNEESATMQEERFAPGWMDRQFRKAEADVAAWADWEKRLAGIEQKPLPRADHPQPQPGQPEHRDS